MGLGRSLLRPSRLEADTCRDGGGRVGCGTLCPGALPDGPVHPSGLLQPPLTTG